MKGWQWFCEDRKLLQTHRKERSLEDVSLLDPGSAGPAFFPGSLLCWAGELLESMGWNGSTAISADSVQKHPHVKTWLEARRSLKHVVLVGTWGGWVIDKQPATDPEIKQNLVVAAFWAS